MVKISKRNLLGAPLAAAFGLAAPACDLPETLPTRHASAFRITV